MMVDPATANASPNATLNTTSTPAQPLTEFQAADRPTEQHNGTVLLVEAYAILWCILMAWIALLWRKQKGLHARLDDLERAIDRAAESPAPAGVKSETAAAAGG